MDENTPEFDPAFCSALNSTVTTETLEELLWSILGYP